MPQLVIPRLDTQSSLQFAYNLGQLNLDEPAIFEAKMNWVQPFGMLLVSSAIKQFRHRFLDIPFHFRCSFEDDAIDVISYASHMGFFKSISEAIDIGKSPGEAPGNSNYIPITDINLEQIHQAELQTGEFIEIGETVERKSEQLSDVLCRDDSELKKLMTYLIREILRNIPEHSKSSIARICGQYWNNQTAEIAILDEGIGIRNSLRENPHHRSYINTDADAIEYAVKAGISQAFNPQRKNPSRDVWANSGFGLYMVSEICRALQGSFCLASGGKCIIINECEKRIYDTHIQGTAIQMRFSTQKLTTSREIIKKIAAQGEAEAQKLRNAFRQASTPSKGLITDF